MFGLAKWKQTQFYKDVKLEGEAKGKLEGLQEGKLKTIPRLVKLGLSPEQIAMALELDPELINQVISKLSDN
jgi:predicted transposase/invertase (TIGR01784 family)